MYIKHFWIISNKLEKTFETLNIIHNSSNDHKVPRQEPILRPLLQRQRCKNLQRHECVLKTKIFSSSLKKLYRKHTTTLALYIVVNSEV
jgi:hypothetical protein